MVLLSSSSSLFCVVLFVLFCFTMCALLWGMGTIYKTVISTFSKNRRLVDGDSCPLGWVICWFHCPYSERCHPIVRAMVEHPGSLPTGVICPSYSLAVWVYWVYTGALHQPLAHEVAKRIAQAGGITLTLRLNGKLLTLLCFTSKMFSSWQLQFTEMKRFPRPGQRFPVTVPSWPRQLRHHLLLFVCLVRDPITVTRDRAGGRGRGGRELPQMP